MSKHITTRRFALALILLGLAGCQDFLEKPLQGRLLSSNFPVSASDASLATNAVYNTLRNSSYHFGLFPLMDIMSDDARKGSNPSDQASTIGPYDNFTHINTETSLPRWWNTLYEGIKRANVVLEKVPAIQMDDALKTRYLAEASFLRGLYYFDLLRAFGGVPIVTSTVTPATLTRNSTDEVYALIISDLELAVAGLPKASDLDAANAGRATVGAAKSLLARVYLFRGDFVKTEKYALEVINSGEYSLMANFADANSEAGEFGSESIFEIGAMRFEGIENGGDQYGNVQGVRGSPNRGWGFNRPSMDLMNTFEANDPRKEATILYLGEVIDGITILGDGQTPDVTKDANDVVVEIECYNQKVWTPGTQVPPQFGHNRRLIRYADVLLMAAEALNENNKPAEALPYLNQVRARARDGAAGVLPDISDTNQATLRDKIFHERRVELALEGHRFWDLVRTGRAAAVLGPLGFIAGKHELLAIPQTEIDLSQKVLTQNPGWE
ncbi:MAG: RagB/SusD family nutrient uptake outer membrane protein [Cyclobacteriaceae bacterium]|nr:RagB/SusD family nutrient uptake outer membrane protein [Cyclobacteriaceae bacterium]